jgi:hypothetical protein
MIKADEIQNSQLPDYDLLINPSLSDSYPILSVSKIFYTMNFEKHERL